MGIIDTLSAGFSAVNKRLWVILIPIFLDLFLWLGPRLSANDLVQSFISSHPDLATTLTSGVAEQADAISQFNKAVDLLAGADYFKALAWQIPSLMYTQMSDSSNSLLNMPTFAIHGGWILAGLLLGMGLLSLLLQSAYLGGIAHAIRSGEAGLKSLVDRVAVYWVRLIGFFGLIVVAAMFLGTPVLVMTALINFLSPMVANLIVGLLAAIVLWIGLYLFFAISAMFISDVGPLRGAWYSFSVMRRYFWSALGLIILMMMIRFGVSWLWGLFLGNPVGVVTAIIGNAYVDAGLAAACMIYFRDRFMKLQGDSGYAKQPAQNA